MINSDLHITKSFHQKFEVDCGINVSIIQAFMYVLHRNWKAKEKEDVMEIRYISASGSLQMVE